MERCPLGIVRADAAAGSTAMAAARRCQPIPRPDFAVTDVDAAWPSLLRVVSWHSATRCGARPTLRLSDCAGCHPATMDATGTLLVTGFPGAQTSAHINGWSMSASPHRTDAPAHNPMPTRRGPGCARWPWARGIRARRCPRHDGGDAADRPCRSRDGQLHTVVPVYESLSLNATFVRPYTDGIRIVFAGWGGLFVGRAKQRQLVGRC